MGAGVLTYAVLAGISRQSHRVTLELVILGMAGLVGLAATTLLIMPWGGAARRAVNPAMERRVVASQWLRLLIWSAVPWLAPIPAMLVLLALMLVMPALISDREVVETVNVAFGFVFFTAFCGTLMVSMLEWAECWSNFLDHAGLRTTEVPWRSTLVAFVIGVASILLGVVLAIMSIVFVLDVQERIYHLWKVVR
jgi:hypothetical protein